MGNKDDNTGLEGLSDEERAALKEDDDATATDAVKGEQGDKKTEEKAQANDETNAGGDGDKDDDKEKGTVKDGEEDKAATEKAAADTETGESAESEESGEEEADIDRPAVPPYVPPAVENYDAQVKTLKDERRALVAKFQDGEITLDAMLEKRDELDEKLNTLRDQQRSHDLLRTQSEHDAKRTWEIEVAHFQRAHKEYSVDKDGKPLDPVMFNALDGLVKQLAADPANADKPAHWFLDEAHAMIANKMQPPKPAVKEAAQGGDGKTPVAKSRKPDLSVVPKTLADVPAAESEKPATDEFAHLDKLTGLELEQAVARLTPDQQARYANG